MVGALQTGLLPVLARWLEHESSVRAAVLFGSQARAVGEPASADGWSDIDLQIVTADAEGIVSTDWANIFPGERLCLKVLRPATSGMRKLTLLYASGEIDLVLVPAWQMRVVRLALLLRLHRKIRVMENALNNLGTIMGGGYRMLKGDREWGPFYARVVAEMPGFRLDDAEIRRMAEVFLCDLLWVLQKLERGEFIAAQRVLHRALHETNVVLLHELRVRHHQPTFQQARRVEQLIPPAQIAMVKISARLERAEIAAAAWQMREGLNAVMSELVPTWREPVSIKMLLARFAPTSSEASGVQATSS